MKATFFYKISFLLQCICFHSVAQTEGLIQNNEALIYSRTIEKVIHF